jgi:O-antigen/teichoic acid export membrane protein
MINDQHEAKSCSALYLLPRTLSQHVLKGFLWTVLAALLNQGTTFVSSLLLARILGLKLFGYYSIVLSVVMTAATISQGGSGLAAAKFIAEFRASSDIRASSILSLCRKITFWTGISGALIVLSFGNFLAERIYHSPPLMLPLKLAALAVFFQTGVSYLQGALQGFAAFPVVSRAGLRCGILQIVLACGGGLWGGLNGAIIGFVLASAGRYLVYRHLLEGVARSHRVATNGKLNSHDLALIWRFALPAALSGLITVPAQSVVIAILARLPEGAELAGLYAAANQIRLLTLHLPTILNTVTVPALNNLKGRHEHREFKNLYTANLVATFFAALVTLLPLVVVAPRIFSMYGGSFIFHGSFAYVLLLSVIPEATSGAIYQLVQSLEKMWHSVFLIAIPRDLTFVALSYYLAPVKALDGVATAYLSAQIIAFCATSLVARKALNARLERSKL